MECYQHGASVRMEEPGNVSPLKGFISTHNGGANDKEYDKKTKNQSVMKKGEERK